MEQPPQARPVRDITQVEGSGTARIWKALMIGLAIPTPVRTISWVVPSAVNVPVTNCPRPPSVSVRLVSSVTLLVAVAVAVFTTGVFRALLAHH
jgi:hypothetical protein